MADISQAPSEENQVTSQEPYEDQPDVTFKSLVLNSN